MNIDRNQDLMNQQYQNQTRNYARQHQLAGEAKATANSRNTIPTSLKNPRLLAILILAGLIAASLALPGTISAQDLVDCSEGGCKSAIQQDYEYALYRLSLREYERAEEILNAVIEADPEHAGAYAARAMAAYLMQDYEGAIADSQTAIELKPDYASPYWVMGTAYYDQEDYASAQIAYETYLELATEYVDPEIPARLEICQAMIAETEA